MCCERSEDAQLGVAARRARAARAPSSVWSGGMRMSTITTSGCVSWTASSASSASAALATISWPASASRRASPSRNSAESSPITMRTAPPPRWWCRRRRRSRSRALPADGADPVARGRRAPSRRRRGAARCRRRRRDLDVPLRRAIAARRSAVASACLTRSRSPRWRRSTPSSRRRRVAARAARRSTTGIGMCCVSGESAAWRPSSRLLGRRPWAICASSATAVPSSATVSSIRPSTSSAVVRGDAGPAAAPSPGTTSRCCAPSCRSRSSRPRSSYLPARSRARLASTSRSAAVSSRRRRTSSTSVADASATSCRSSGEVDDDPGSNAPIGASPVTTGTVPSRRGRCPARRPNRRRPGIM